MKGPWLPDLDTYEERRDLLLRYLAHVGVVVLCTTVGFVIGSEVSLRTLPETDGAAGQTFFDPGDWAYLAMYHLPFLAWATVLILPVGLWALRDLEPRRVLLPGLMSATVAGLLLGPLHVLGLLLAIPGAWCAALLIGKAFAVPVEPGPVVEGALDGER